MNLRRLFANSYLLLVLLVVPAIGLNEAIAFLAENRQKAAISQAMQELVKIRNDLMIHSDTASFLVNRLTVMFSDSPSPEKFDLSCRQFLVQHNLDLQFAIYSRAGELLFKQIPSEEENKQSWHDAGRSLQKVLFEKDQFLRFVALDELRPVWGKHFFLPENEKGSSYVAKFFYQSDFDNDRFRYWAAGNEKYLVVVRFPTADIKKDTGLRLFLNKNLKGHISFAIFRNHNLISAKTPIDSRIVKMAFLNLERNAEREFFASDDLVFSRVKIEGRTWVLLISQLVKPKLRHGLIIFAILCLILTAFISRHRQGSHPDRFENLSLLRQVALLMFIAGGIPLVILGSVAVNYFINKKTALIRAKNEEMIDFILQVDRNIQIDHARYARLINQASESFPKILAEKDSSNKLVGLIKNTFAPVPVSVLVLEAHKDRADARKIVTREIASDIYPTDRDFVRILGTSHLGALNQTRTDEFPVEKVFILESVFQKPMNMIVHDLLRFEGKISEMGWGIRKITLLANAFQILKQEFFDHYIFIFTVSNEIEEKYIRRNLHDALRNNLGIKILVEQSQILVNQEKPLESFPEINRLFQRVADYPLPEPEIIDFQGEKHLFVGLKGSRSINTKFCALFSVAVIEEEIRNEIKGFFYPVFLGASLLGFMVLVLHFNLLLPVSCLHQAALALVRRDSSFRLPEDTGDEFSEMARIFNASIADFEELQIASIVQKHLLPTKPLEIEGFKIFGKCHPMIELGGDYFDYFNVDEKHFALMLGDVAGHGVGASLLMAMAKGGVMCARDVQNDPAAILSRLHHIIFAVRNKVQRKIMTFQYFLVNSQTNRIHYANAGGCSPALVDAKTKSVKEINHQGAVLGGFKKNVFSNIELAIEPGQAIILYTDGLVEARNDSGKELGYENLFAIFVRSFHPDAHEFYSNIMKEFRDWLGDSIAGDDITLIVMVRA